MFAKAFLGENLRLAPTLITPDLKAAELPIKISKHLGDIRSLSTLSLSRSYVSTISAGSAMIIL